MVTTSRSGAPRRGPDRGPGTGAPEDLLGHACALLRLCGQDAAIAAVLLFLVAMGTVTQLAYAGWPSLLAQLPLVAVTGAFATSASLAVRSRRTLVSALGSVRAATGAPLDPSVPWTPIGLAASLDTGLRDAELRRLLGAAHRCADLAWQAVVWGVVTAVLFALWSLVMAAAGPGG
ncbi:hypothetical protein [Actinomadura sp. SCN-SB]|uniref:hypothetical protein n=1 Tax=Actinomadura sp. SCN-SB TaxID=3373092 RepID=UPI003751F3CF